MDPILSLDSITKSFHDNEEVCPALAGISFDAYPNEILCIMGPSGCGKSTLAPDHRRNRKHGYRCDP